MRRGRRRRRCIHRRGAVFRATLRPLEAPAGAGPTDHPRSAMVRISHTFGWRRPLPDWVGMAVRVFDHRTDGDHLDLLMVSAATEPDLWCRLKPYRDALACSFSSAVRHRVDGTDQIVVAVPAERRSGTIDELIGGQARCPIRYRLDSATERGSWHGLGELVLTERLDDDRAIRFTPPRSGPRLFTTIRRLLYRLAQGRSPTPAR